MNVQRMNVVMRIAVHSSFESPLATFYLLRHPDRFAS